MAKHTGAAHVVREYKNEELGDCADERHLKVVGFEPAPRVSHDFVTRAVYHLW